MILVTGHEPPEGFDANPSATLARRLGGESVLGHRIAGEVLPADATAAGDAVVAAIEHYGPDAVVGAGFTPGAPELAVERLGLTVDDWLAVEDDSRDAEDVDHPVGYFATLPAETIVDRLADRGIPARLSTAASTAVCDHFLFDALSHVTENELEVAIGYIHLPCTPEQSVRHSRNGRGSEFLPSMAAETQLEGLVAAVQSTAQALED